MPGTFLDRFRRVFLGSGATFRNAHRNWLYLGFLILIVVVLVLSAARKA